MFDDLSESHWDRDDRIDRDFARESGLVRRAVPPAPFFPLTIEYYGRTWTLTGRSVRDLLTGEHLALYRSNTRGCRGLDLEVWFDAAGRVRS